jgi:hypothetical protein
MKKWRRQWPTQLLPANWISTPSCTTHFTFPYIDLSPTSLYLSHPWPPTRQQRSILKVSIYSDERECLGPKSCTEGKAHIRVRVKNSLGGKICMRLRHCLIFFTSFRYCFVIHFVPRTTFLFFSVVRCVITLIETGVTLSHTKKTHAPESSWKSKNLGIQNKVAVL